MKTLVAAAVLAAFASLAAAAPPGKPIASGLKTPASVAVGPDGKVYVSLVGAPDKSGTGDVVRIEDGKAVPFAEGLDEPLGLAFYNQVMFVADRTRVLRIDLKGKVTPFAPATAFPTAPKFLSDVVADPESGTVYVSDFGDLKGGGGAVYKVTPKGNVSLVVDAAKLPNLHRPARLAMDGQSHLLLADAGTGALYRIKLADGSAEKLAEGLGALNGLTWDKFGRFFFTDAQSGKVFGIPRPGMKPVLVAEGFESAADLCYDPVRKQLLVPDMKAGTVTAIPTTIPGFEVDETPFALKTELAFPQIKWTGWSAETDTGKSNQHRPLVLTHAGDGSNRVFLATEHGVIHVFPNDPKVGATKVFLDITDRVKYDDKTNEEGFLGLCFHPKYKQNGEFFVFYTPKKEKMVNVVSRFRVSKDDPDRADPASEEQVLRFEKRPFWNHDGGTVIFGPDGYLYTTHGDGGLGNDPYDNGQNLGSLFGKIHRIDVDKKEDGKNYAIPKDNPFVSKPGARPEIWAYGLRNIWRMAFDKQTGQLWAGEVGQNLYEEINLIVKGGNYGWNRRESLHPFGPRGTGPKPEFIEPIWEYHHDVGKSVTGGAVYRGAKLPELAGHYVYADYVSNKIWALKYDEAKGRVTANRPIPDRNRPVFSFGEDEQGELYVLTGSTDGKGVFVITK